MRHNAVKAKVLRGEPAIGAELRIPSPELVEFYGLLGFEWICINAEHGPIDWVTCQAMCRACDARGLSSIVRVPTLDHSLIAKYLQTGALGLAVPHINTAEQAEAVVRAARYAPEGRRGSDWGSNRASDYGLLAPAHDYFERANQELLIAIWIEEVEGMKNLDEILQVPGVDAINFGAGDLSLSMGLAGRQDHPDVQAAIIEGKRKALAAGKVLIGEPTNALAAKRQIADGALLIATNLTRMWEASGRAFLSEMRGH